MTSEGTNAIKGNLRVLSAVKALPAKKARPHLGQHGSCLEGLKVHGDKKGKQTYVRANLLAVLVLRHTPSPFLSHPCLNPPEPFNATHGWVAQSP